MPGPFSLVGSSEVLSAPDKTVIPTQSAAKGRELVAPSR
jgi:hypothetical protein